MIIGAAILYLSQSVGTSVRTQKNQKAISPTRQRDALTNYYFSKMVRNFLV